MSAAFIGAAVTLLTLAHLPGVVRADTCFLFLSALMALGIPVWQLTADQPDRLARQFGLATAATFVLALLLLALPIALGRFTVGVVYPRSLAMATMALMLAGLTLGAYIGFLLRRHASRNAAGAAGLRALAVLAIAGTLCLSAVNAAHQLRLIPDFATYASEWDARHQRIIEQRESGLRDIEVAPFTFDLSQYIAAHGASFDMISPYFYRVDSIVTRED